MATTAAPALAPLAAGTQVAKIGVGYLAEVVASEVTERGHRRTVLRWAESIPAVGVREGEEFVWVQVAGRTPRFIVAANN